MREDAGGELREKRAALEARIANLSGRLQRLAACIADGTMEVKDVGPLAAPLRKQREEAQAHLDALPVPKPVPDIEDIDIEGFRAKMLSIYEEGDIATRRKVLDRIVDEIKLLPGKALVQYLWKAEPDAKSVRGPSGGPCGGW